MALETVQSRVEIKFAGYGGQGIALMANIFGKAVQLHTDKKSVLTQSYGPESRGGASSADVVVDDNEIDYPYTESGNVGYFIVMSKEAYTKYAPYLKKGGILFYDIDLVEIDEKTKKLAGKIYGIPATAIAERVGMKIAANIVMLGHMAGNSDIIPSEVLKNTVLSSVPSKFKLQNEKAFDEGFNYKKN